jgi:hypothetical protein
VAEVAAAGGGRCSGAAGSSEDGLMVVGLGGEGLARARDGLGPLVAVVEGLGQQVVRPARRLDLQAVGCEAFEE